MSLFALELTRSRSFDLLCSSLTEWSKWPRGLGRHSWCVLGVSWNDTEMTVIKKTCTINDISIKTDFGMNKSLSAASSGRLGNCDAKAKQQWEKP